MPTESGKPLIVISYAHADEPEHPAEGEVKWLSFVTGYLRPAIKHLAVVLWTDWRTPGGADWEREIEQKLRACDIFILLVSPHSLSSDYIIDKEIPIIRERLVKGDPVRPYPLVLMPTPGVALDVVHDWNLRPRDGKPLSGYPLHERYRHINEAANEIAEIAAKVVARGPAQAAARSLGTPVQFTNRASLETWARGQNREIVLAIAARAALRVAPMGFVRLPGAGAMQRMSNSMSAIFRAAAVAWVSGKLSTRADELRGGALLAAAQAAVASEARAGARFVSYAQSAAEAAARVAGYPDDSADARGADAANAADAAASALADLTTVFTILADVVGSDNNPATAEIAGASTSWSEVSNDIEVARSRGATAVLDMQLWTSSLPKWVRDAWKDVRAHHPEGQGWEVWFDWYEERLRGGSRGEDYELAFASVPQKEWDKGPAAANAWITANLPALSGEPDQRALPDIDDRESLEIWLKDQSREVAVLIAARAALRVAPLAVRTQPGLLQGLGTAVQLSNLTGAIFRASASARAAAKYRDRANELRRAAFATGAAAAAAAALTTDDAYDRPDETDDTAASAANAAFAAAAADAFAATDVAVTRAAAAAYFAAVADSAAIWSAVQTDVENIQARGAGATADLPLWTNGGPAWANAEWIALKTALPKDEDWEVWIDWYEERLRGGSLDEDYELVFATVPQEEWDKGPAAANAWIKAHLPKMPGAARPVELPPPVTGLDAPFAYGWTASQRVAVVAGAQNLPDYRHSSSEEDHRHALEACRVGGERLLKALRGGRYNARKEYGEALEYYLNDLPKTAGAGNILLANDQVRVLHDMFLADATTLSEGFASRLKSVIANQFALNAFYELVQRHNDAVSAGNWTQPFPLDAAKAFFGAVEDNTPRWFARDVEQGLRQVERAEPPPAAAPIEPTSASAIEPPQLPPGTPAAQDSWKRQMATAANALWETFRQGETMPVDKDEWRKAAEELGVHVRPIIDFLRAQEEQKG